MTQISLYDWYSIIITSRITLTASGVMLATRTKRKKTTKAPKVRNKPHALPNNIMSKFWCRIYSTHYPITQLWNVRQSWLVIKCTVITCGYMYSKTILSPLVMSDLSGMMWHSWKKKSRIFTSTLQWFYPECCHSLGGGLRLPTSRSQSMARSDHSGSRHSA